MNKPKIKVLILEGRYGINAEYSKVKKSYTGMMYEIWQKVKKGLETKYTFEEKFMKSVDFEHLVDDVYNGTYDIIIGDTIISHTRLEKVNFTNPLYINKHAILFKKASHPFIAKIVYILKNVLLLPFLFLILLGAIFGNILHYVEPNRYIKSDVKKIYARRRNVLTTTAALLGEMGFLFENSSVSYLGMFIIIIIAIISMTVLMVLQAQINSKMGEMYSDRFSFHNIKKLNLVAPYGYLSAKTMKHFGASVKFIKNSTLDDVIKKYIVNSNKFDGIPLDLENARAYAKTYNLSVSANDIGWALTSWIVTKKYPNLVVEINTELDKLKQTMFIKDMCNKYFVSKKDVHLCIF